MGICRSYHVLVDYVDFGDFMLLDKELEIWKEEYPRWRELGSSWGGLMFISLGNGSEEYECWYRLDKAGVPCDFSFDDVFKRLVISGDEEVVRRKMDELMVRSKVEGISEGEVKGMVVGDKEGISKGVSDFEVEDFQDEDLGMV